MEINNAHFTDISDFDNLEIRSSILPDDTLYLVGDNFF